MQLQVGSFSSCNIPPSSRGKQSKSKMSCTGDIAGFLRHVSLFQDLPESELTRIAESMEVQEYPRNAVIFREHDEGDAFYVILEGEAFVKASSTLFLQVGDMCRLAKGTKVAGKLYPKGTPAVVDNFDGGRAFPFTIYLPVSGDRGRVRPEELELDPEHENNSPERKEDKVLASCRAGDFFGEIALIKHTTRQATVVAGPQQTLRLARLAKSRFDALDLRHGVVFPKRNAVIAAHRLAQLTPVQKSKEATQLIIDALAENQYLHEMVSITEEQCEILAGCAVPRTVRAGEVLCKEGDVAGQEFFVVESGKFHFHVQQHHGSGEVDRVNQFGLIKDCGRGGSFGEVTLLHAHARHCTVQAVENSKVWVIDRATFQHVMRESFKEKIQEYKRCVDTIKQFSCLYESEREALCETLYEQHYLQGERLLTAGELGDTFFILLSGAIAVAGKVVDRPGTYFGEKSLIGKTPVKDTVIAHSADVLVACLTKHDFDQLLQPFEDILQQHATLGEKRVSPLDQGLTAASRKQDSAGGGGEGRTQGNLPVPVGMQTSLKRSDLKRLGLLGCGGFGAVTLEQAPDGQVYALKQLSKGYVVQEHMEDSTMNERNILLLCDSKFIVKCYATFNTDQSLWFLLEAALGGELYATYHRHKLHGSASRARFYAASVLFAFQHLHQKFVVYRDLKPENLLLDDRGRCKLTDMGLAKQTKLKTMTTCGTPDYFAPEVIAGAGHHFAVDWWTLGVLVHELMCGHTPFEDSSPSKIYQKVNKGVSYVKFPYAAKEPHCKDLVIQLLKRSPHERLPMRAGGVDNVKKHEWYGSFDWAAHEWETNEVPYKPNVKAPTDMSNFKAKESDIPPQVHYTAQPGSTWDKHFATNT